MRWRPNGPASDIVAAVRAALQENATPSDPLAKAAFEWLCEVDDDEPWPAPLLVVMTENEASRLAHRAGAMRRLIAAGEVDSALGLSLVVWPSAGILEAEESYAAA